MELHVVKTGADTFDALHAYGLGVVLAYASHSPTELADMGTVYRIHSPQGLSNVSTDVPLREILALPSPEDIQARQQKHDSPPVTLANLDGLLAALFTTPGARLVSVDDMLGKQRLAQTAVENGLSKAQAALARWNHYIRHASRRSADWVSELLQDYDAAHPKTPTPVAKGKSGISIPMTVEPAFSWSTRRPISDGLITDKTNVTMTETRYAALLTLIGAARFLRAQRVAGRLVSFYVPLPGSVTVRADTTLPRLRSTNYASYQALALQWLRYRKTATSLDAHWSGLAYHVMQTQGAQQSISLGRGCLDYSWLAALGERTGASIAGYWQALLGRSQEQLPLEIDNLVDCLLCRNAANWIAHLRDSAICLHGNSNGVVRPYTLQETKEVTTAMIAPTNDPLRSVLEHEEGTLRFGHALRLLGQFNPAPLCDITDALDAVQTCDQLVRTLALAAQECAVAGAKSQFIIVPCDEDLKCLLDDVDRFGAHTIAGLLIILSTLRYPRRDDTEAGDESITPEQREGGSNGNQ